MIVEPIGVVPSYIVIVSPGVPVPLIVGCGSFVGGFGKTRLPPSSVMPLMAGFAGSPVGTFTDIGVEEAPMSPWLSMEIAVNECEPAFRSAVGVKDQLPFESTSAVPIMRTPSKISTVVPASAVPVMTGFVLLAVPPLIAEPTDVMTALCGS